MSEYPYDFPEVRTSPMPPDNVRNMTIRDWFAGQALAWLLAADDYGPSAFMTTAIDAYKMADAMLAERSKK